MALTDNDLMPFGIHYGKKMANVPAKYLLFMYDSGKCFGEVKAYIESNLEFLKEEAKK